MSGSLSKSDIPPSTASPGVQKYQRGPMIKPSRPTHFLSFPIRDPSCHARASELSKILLDAVPRPDGVDESLVVHPKSLHLTLGIMTLLGRQAVRRLEDAAEDAMQIDSGEEHKPLRKKEIKSVDDAAKLLRESQQALQESLRSNEVYKGSIPVKLDRLESFQSDPTKCRVLYAEPEKNSEGVKTLHELAEHLRECFLGAGMLTDAKQPLTLHCTLMKASARKNKPHRPPRPDPSGPDTMTEPANTAKDRRDEAVVSAGEEPPQLHGQPKKSKRRRGRFPKKHPFDGSLLLAGSQSFELGVSNIDRVQLCQMGRHLPSGEYEALEEILLFPRSDEMAA